MTESLPQAKGLGVYFLVSTFFPVVGGVQRAVGDLSAGLDAAGAEIAVVTRRLPGLPRFSLVRGVEVHRLGIASHSKLGALTYLVDGFVFLALRRRHYQILHAQNIDAPLVLCLFAGLVLRRHRVITIHGEQKILRSRSSLLGRWRLRSLSRWGCAHCALTDNVRDVLSSIGVPPERIANIPNGIEVSTYRPPEAAEKAALRKRLGVELDATVFLYLGRLVALKQVDVLLKAWSSAAPAGARLLIVGSGPEADGLQRLAGDYGCRNVRFCGETEEPETFLRAADVFVLPSREEGLSMALLEALASGLAVVATDLPGHRSVLKDGENGILVQSSNTSELEQAIRHLSEDQQARAKLGRAGRALIAASYSLQASVRCHVLLYRKLTGVQ